MRRESVVLVQDQLEEMPRRQCCVVEGLICNSCGQVERERERTTFMVRLRWLRLQGAKEVQRNLADVGVCRGCNYKVVELRINC